MRDSDSGIAIDSGIFPFLTGIGIRIGIKHLENSWNWNRNQALIPLALRVSLESESESESSFQSKPGVGIGIKTLPESCTTGMVILICTKCKGWVIKLHYICPSKWANFCHYRDLSLLLDFLIVSPFGLKVA